MTHKKRLFPARVARMAALLLLPMAGCGFTPPPEFNEVANLEPSEVPAVAPAPVDAGVEPGPKDAGLEPVETNGMKGSLQLGVGFSTIPAMPIAQLLGMGRDAVETLLSPVKPESREERVALRAQKKEGWIRYTEHLRVRYDENDIIVELEQNVPDDISCADAAKWLGFAAPKDPVEKDDTCEWPKDDEAHLLAEETHGDLNKTTRLFHAVKPAPVPPVQD